MPGSHGLLQTISNDKNEYWNHFYASRDALKLSAPSQFAAFAAQEAGDAHLIIEVGCGTGRDSLFFARHGFDVFAIDGSEAAIAGCEQSRVAQGLERISFACCAVGTDAFGQTLIEARGRSGGPALAYARFFLHAISDEDELCFFRDMAAALRPGDRLAVEYRTIRDANGAKVTQPHFRRFVEPAQVVANAVRSGFVEEYGVEGYGYAKYLNDDAYVARAVFRKTATP
jgi:SAM-dependent methyltransferase